MPDLLNFPSVSLFFGAYLGGFMGAALTILFLLRK